MTGIPERPGAKHVVAQEVDLGFGYAAVKPRVVLDERCEVIAEGVGHFGLRCILWQRLVAVLDHGSLEHRMQQRSLVCIASNQ